jgi:hypothetical protein
MDVDCTATVTIPADVPAIPLQFVARTPDAVLVHDSTGRAHAITGIRVGPYYAVADALPAGTVLILPPAPPAEDRSEFAGTIAPGDRMPVVIGSRIWGRVKTLIPDGSAVAEGDQVMTLYSPWLESRQDRLKPRREQAEQRFRQAAAERRLQAIEANLSHRRKVLRERGERVRRQALAETDPVAEVVKQNAYESARLGQRDAQSALAAASGPAFPPAERAALALTAAQADLAVQRARLGLVTALRQRNWLDIATADVTWLQARGELADRELLLQLARRSEQVAQVQAQLALQTALADSKHAAAFARGRIVLASAAGRLFYKTGFNAITGQAGKIEKESEVWSGLEVAEILDMQQLTFVAELPELWYRRLTAGDVTAGLVFDELEGVELPTQLLTIGRAFTAPADRERDEAGVQALASMKVFKATFSFAPPPGVELLPGGTGKIRLRLDAGLTEDGS